MHKSKLAGFIIDCETQDVEAATKFWGAALGLAARRFPDAEGERYMQLQYPDDSLHIEVQQVSHPSRVHLDIETDDIEAEVRRLEGLGAKRVGPVKSWYVMEAPTGQRFCVVRRCTSTFDELASVWDR